MSDSNKIRIGPNLQLQLEIMEKQIGRKITIQEIAVGISVSPDYVRKILSNKRTGSARILTSLAEFFKCSVDDLVMPNNKTCLNKGVTHENI